MNDLPKFKSGQIVALEAEDACLYAEVIQVVSDRQVCWVRPLMLVESAAEGSPVSYDLRESSDLIWPLQLFRAALDTEAIPLLVELDGEAEKGAIAPGTHRRFRAFISRIWNAHPRAFQKLGETGENQSAGVEYS